MSYTYKILRSGQPRPYADTERVVEITLEKGLTKQQASDIVENMDIGYSTKAPDNPFSPKLSYFKETTPGTWEFKTISMYTG